MAKKKEAAVSLKPLAPRLPSEAKELKAKGFKRNLSGAKTFITDGHTLVLREFASPEFLKGVKGDGTRPPIGVVAITSLWNKVADRKHVAVQFIGCGKTTKVEMSDDLERSKNVVEVVLACLTDAKGRIILVDPWKLAWAVRATKADTLGADSGPRYNAEAITICRGTTMVGMVMPMGYYASDLKEWDLKAEPISLDKAFAEKPIK